MKFSTPGVHHLVVADDFCEFAHDIRRELVSHPAWKEMSQDETYGGSGAIRFERQNGITTGHLDQSHRTVLPHCLAFADFLTKQLADLCATTGVAFDPRMDVEMNAMAYGEGGWLSPHTDHDDDASPRRIAWMLYLTDPDDGEWETEKGGAVRLIDAHGPVENIVRVRPRFNRFAMFAVSDDSHHEIERVTWACGWSRCRLALSGWIRGPEDSPARLARLYVQRADAARLKAQAETRLRGALAMYRLMREQRVHAGQDVSDLDDLVQRCDREYAAHAAAPEGTVFLRYVPGPANCILVLDERKKVVYFGPPAPAQG